MQGRKRKLPPLNALRTFEAAARHENFKSAAEELCVTQAAVSRQIQTLENYFGLTLFHRGNRLVSLTEAGKKLQATASHAFQNIADTSAELVRKQDRNYLSLYTTTAFAQLWLIPRLKELHHQYSDIHLHLISGEGSPGRQNDLDAAISLGLEEHSQYAAEYLFSEEIFPVCTPEYLSLNPQIASLDGLLQTTLLNLNAHYWQANLWQPMDWGAWLAHLNIDAKKPRDEMQFSQFSMLLDAVHQGLGVGLGWRHLVQSQLDKGNLVQPLTITLTAEDRKHYFICRRSLENTPQIKALKHWLLAQTQAFRSPSA